MLKVQCNRNVVLGEDHKLGTCPQEKDLIKYMTNKNKTYKKGFVSNN
jgi:hypothetical protein